MMFDERIPWPLLKRIVTWLVLTSFIVLVVFEARKIAWDDVLSSVHSYSVGTLLAAGLFTVLSYVVYSCFDLVGRRYIGATVRTRDVMATAFVSFAFNQNFGALLGTVGLRLKLYSSLGVGIQDISRVILLSVVTNWLGYTTLVGGMLSLRLIKFPGFSSTTQYILQLIGVLMLSLVAFYLWLCAHSKRRHVQVRNVRVDLPSISLAGTQLLLSISHWPFTAATIYVLLDHKIDFISVLGTFMLTSMAIIIIHLPAGIGVLEGMFVIMLGHRVPRSEILAALLVFRAYFYIGAVSVAGVVYLLMEAGKKSSPATSLPFRRKSP